MTEVKVATASEEVGRLGTVAAWISAAACLPYLFLKVVWTLDMPVGITDRSVLRSGGWVAGNAVMALVRVRGCDVVKVEVPVLREQTKGSGSRVDRDRGVRAREGLRSGHSGP